MSAAPTFRLPTKAVLGLAIAAVLLLTAVLLEVYSYRQKHAVITEQHPIGADQALLKSLPPDTSLPTIADLTPEAPPATLAGMPTVETGGQGGPAGFMRAPTPPDVDPKIARGAAAVVRHKCNTCHSLDGSALISTSLRRLFGKQSKLVDGTTVTVDEAYLRESILDPNAKKVLGPSVPMPSYAGQISDEDIDAIIAYIQSLDK